jgi:hypothetical protein
LPNGGEEEMGKIVDEIQVEKHLVDWHNIRKLNCTKEAATCCGRLLGKG